MKSYFVDICYNKIIIIIIINREWGLINRAIARSIQQSRGWIFYCKDRTVGLISSLLYGTFYYENQYNRNQLFIICQNVDHGDDLLAFLLCHFVILRIIKFTVWIFFVARFSIFFSFKAKKLNFFFFRILSLFLFTMPTVITEKSRHVSNQSQRTI